MQHWVLQAAMMDYNTKRKKQSLITLKQMISMQIEFANTT